MVTHFALDEMSWSAWRDLVVQALVIFIFNEIKMYSVESDKVHVILTLYHKLAKASNCIEKILDELFVPDVEQRIGVPCLPKQATWLGAAVPEVLRTEQQELL